MTNQDKMNIFISWSGGKETAFSCYKAMQNQDIKVSCFLNMVSKDGKHSRTHGISSELLRLQAEAIGVPIVQKRTTWETYEEEFKKAISDFKKENIRAGGFGDIDLKEHREWVERVCRESDIKPIFPLWQGKREEILRDFINSGFEAIVVATKKDILGQKWLGRKIDERFIKDLKGVAGVDLCGEAGEYHTFVTSGPIFKKSIKILKTKKIENDKHCFLDILDYETTEKI